ncbi:hypothetical protein J6590_075771 [Homalodisca vitripennis]|nr:hypothetical protein J6590_075771 [Homalodisca vitripennis]
MTIFCRRQTGELVYGPVTLPYRNCVLFLYSETPVHKPYSIRRVLSSKPRKRLRLQLSSTKELNAGRKLFALQVSYMLSTCDGVLLCYIAPNNI